MDIKEFYIDGEWVSPDGTDVIDLINPANEEITGSIISASKKMLMMQLNQQKKVLK